MTHKILIVEDDSDDQLLFIETISSIDPFFECHTVDNGSEALDFLHNTTTLPSLILLDLNMPLMNGYEFLEKVKKIDRLKDIPVVIFSTSKSPQDIQRTQKLGAKSFFTKAFDLDVLKADLTKVLFDESIYGHYE